MKRNNINMAGAILAGGKNSRMKGRNKAFIRIGGEPIIETTISLLGGIFEEVILITNSLRDYKKYAERVTITKDIIKDTGPLGGIHAALSATSKRAVFFVACDMPFLHNDLIHYHLSYFKKKECDCLVPRIGNSIEPLHAIYKTKLKDDICDFLKKGNSHSIRGFLKTINTAYLDLAASPMHQQIFQNLNTPQDVKRLEESPWK